MCCLKNIIFSFNLSFITRATFFRIAKFLPLFHQGPRHRRHHLQSPQRGRRNSFRNALEVRRFSHSQYMDIFRGFSEAIKQIIHTNYHSVHEENLELIIKQLGAEQAAAPLPREARRRTEPERIIGYRKASCGTSLPGPSDCSTSIISSPAS